MPALMIFSQKYSTPSDAFSIRRRLRLHEVSAFRYYSVTVNIYGNKYLLFSVSGNFKLGL
ncbi:hypothetical protein METHB2_200045 [Candidatus Methylobacter favarea]|uniref:Uncharacterized protein n=1 Tax=Candidatus Methylobacter favarea TaxID=2707345 RepID=A0A8S0XRY9_9GAMM|nr:hypothetical protein METHB2_200045 [Candidatus Methylobacter favarea]